MLDEILACARTMLSSLGACWIALIEARCGFFFRVLRMSDRFCCGAVLMHIVCATLASLGMGISRDCSRYCLVLI